MASKIIGPSRKKTVYQLGTPFSTTEWPEVSQENQDAILDLLCSFLEPLGQYRSRHSQPSKGRSSRKRKREAIKKAKAKGDSGMDVDEKKTPKPPVPAIADHIDVGLSAITRSLQAISSPKPPDSHTTTTPSITQTQQPYAAIFVARSGQPSMLHNHLPELVAAASRHPLVVKPIRLVALSQTCADRLTKAVGLPRVSFIAVRVSAPQSKALLDFVEQHVKRVSSAWIDSATTYFKFTPPNITAVQTTIGQKKSRALDTPTATKS
ncbi:hypothetical protein BROUX41_004155 [Berkeleyomyces rouxiae]|uniref:uncharacterized protein n=1 Tax=Berkeleyomyces rouxiae TaxID=2035830 RepID=UPI003B7B7ED5